MAGLSVIDMYKTEIFNTVEELHNFINTLEDYKVIAVGTLDNKYIVTLYKVTENNQTLLENDY